MALKRISYHDAWQLLLDISSSLQAGPAGPTDPRLTILPDGGWNLHAEPEDRLTEDLIDCFLPLCHPTRMPLVFAQVGQSLDGRIATVTGASHYINGEAGLDHLHRLRAVADIVVVGAGTVRSDNPRLTVRRVDGRHPHRAVIDPRRQIPDEQLMFADLSAPTYRVVAGAPQSQNELQASGQDAPITPAGIIECLRSKGYRRIFIEGGSQTVSSFLQAGCLDHLHLIVAPMIIGSGIPALQLPEIDELDRALRPQTHTYNLGSDYLFDMRFAAP